MESSICSNPVAPEADSQEARFQQLEAASVEYDEGDGDTSPETLAQLSSLMRPINPDTSDETVPRVLRALHKHLHGHLDAVALAKNWAKRGLIERSDEELMAMWSAIPPAPLAPPPSEIAYVSDTSKDTFPATAPIPEPVPREAAPKEQSVATAVRTALDPYILNGILPEIEAMAIAQKPVLGRLALMGQATMFYAPPNMGKTLISLSLCISAIKSGQIDPARLYYVNNDDTSVGLAEKLRVAQEYGFKMLAESYQDFAARDLLKILTKMAEGNEAHNVVVIVDTATKVVNVLDAVRTRAFTAVVRKFVMKGGTLVALAHTNKNPGADGKSVYRGTTDVINDFDCVYVLSQTEAGADEKIVEFENKKRRGNVPQSVAYRYSTEVGISYHELLASVEEVDPAELDNFKRLDTQKGDAEVIAAVKAAITSGVNTKMLLADAVAERADTSKRAAMKVIERYTGNDPSLHHWKFSVKERGAKVFELLGTSLPNPSGPIVQP